MGKKVKTGKSRKDKFYHLAKETGYRARSAFKLIQLNRKYGFLQESRALIDLCAAPGGWLQVAANFMPMSSIILGVDLVPIKSIKNVTTFTSDITSDACRTILKKELKGWKTDVVLNDGAPNVGSAWSHDAFTQAQLALSAMKLASEFLRKGGWFITKIFRSKDYTALLWVFQQLFTKVHSTKPQASRSESAEIFVVCQGYLAPDKLDEKFLDPKYVFKEIQDTSRVKLDVLRPEKHVRHRGGYAENNATMFETTTALNFVKSDDAIEVLSTVNKIEVVDETIKNHKATTQEILLCCEDIKVLGRKELKNLFTWRKKLRKELNIKNSDEEEKENEKEGDAEETEKTPVDEEEELDEMVSNLKEEEAKDLKKKRKKVREHKKKLRERLAGKLADASGDASTQDQEMFALSLMNNKKEVDNVNDAEPEEVYEDDTGDELEFESDTGEQDSDAEEVNSSDEEYVYGDDELYEESAKQRKIEDDQGKTLQKSKLKKIQRKSQNPLLVDLEGDAENYQLNKAKQWYQKEVFQDVENNKETETAGNEEEDANDISEEEEDEDYDIEALVKAHKKKGGKVIEKPAALEDDNLDEGVEDMSDTDTDSEDEEYDDRSISQGKQEQLKKDLEKENKKTASKKEGFEVVPVDHTVLGPEALAIGAAIATSRKRKRDIVDDSFNRYAHNDNNLPAWFKEDESKHTLRHVPVTKDEVNFYKQRLMEINARPIKKVIEAKTKKKYKMMKKLESARKRAQGILDATDVSSQEKSREIKGIYKKAGLLSKKTVAPTYVVAKKGLAGKRYKRPSNVKGQYKVVDPRMKKDLKAAQGKEKTKGRSNKRVKKR